MQPSRHYLVRESYLPCPSNIKFILLLVAPAGISVLMHGPSYPDSSDDSKKQSFKLNLLCNTEGAIPKFLSYDGLQVEVEWTHPAACGSDAGGGDNGNEDNGGNDNGKESRGSGVGWFFLVYVYWLSLFRKVQLNCLSF